MSVSTRPNHVPNIAALAWVSTGLLVSIVVVVTGIAAFAYREQPLIVCDKGLCQYTEAMR